MTDDEIDRALADADEMESYMRPAIGSDAKRWVTMCEHVRTLVAEIRNGDYWMGRSKRFREDGGCPVCFASDEAEHTADCLWGKDLADFDRVVTLLVGSRADHAKMVAARNALAAEVDRLNKVVKNAWNDMKETREELTAVKALRAADQSTAHQLGEEIKRLRAELADAATLRLALSDAQHTVIRMQNDLFAARAELDAVMAAYKIELEHMKTDPVRMEHRG